MKLKLVFSMWLLVLITAVTVSCQDGSNKSYDMTDDSYRKSMISVKLPDRQSRLIDDSGEMYKNLDAYLIQIEPSNDDCHESVEKSGVYRDKYWVQIEVNGNCNYEVKVQLGSFQNTLDSVKEGENNEPEEVKEVKQITFLQDINPIIKKNCLECHIKGGLMEYLDFTDIDTIYDRTDQIMSSILNNNMPWKREPLADELKEKFKEWEKNDFPKGEEESSIENFNFNALFNRSLKKEFYQSEDIFVSSKDIKRDSYNLGLLLNFERTSTGKSSGFKTKDFFSEED